MTKNVKQNVDQVPTTAERLWALLRLVLGIGQVTGAVFSFYLLLVTGVNERVVGFVIATCLLTATSILLFGGKKSAK
jgi:hypothetical protein